MFHVKHRSINCVHELVRRIVRGRRMESIVVLIMLLRSNRSCVLLCDESLTHESR